jgi:leader peptidase (prepilin peptidase) / N-methyltransferase
MIPWLIPLFGVFLCWGSFLNVVGYRIIRGYSFTGRSFCPHCRQQLAWYDLIPLISWVALQGRCRTCRNSISLLYPFIELLTAVLLSCMVLSFDYHYWLGYGIFISALIVTIRTDFEKMLISRFMTWGLLPVAFVLSFFGLLPLTLLESVRGALFGYAVLWLIAKTFHAIRNIEGMGEGDIDLLAMIGAFTGITGAWTALLLGSLLGTCASLVHFLVSRHFHLKIAFGPWLAAGALIYIFFQDQILLFIDMIQLG